jgi:hypothetical protein
MTPPPGVPGPCAGGLSKVRGVASEANANALMLVPPVKVRAEVNATAGARTSTARKRFATPSTLSAHFR